VVQQLRDNSRDNTSRQALFLDDAGHGVAACRDVIVHRARVYFGGTSPAREWGAGASAARAPLR